jgi:hypothetical protein
MSVAYFTGEDEDRGEVEAEDRLRLRLRLVVWVNFDCVLLLLYLC